MNAVADPVMLKHRPDLSLAYADVKGLQPNMSPTVFTALQEAIATVQRPTILETGIGLSTYHLCDQLRKGGGTYIGVEHNWGWFEVVEAWIRRLLTLHAGGVPVEQRRFIGPLQPKYYPKPVLHVDSLFAAGPLTITLLLRQATGLTGDGTAEEFHEYLEAIAGPVDVAIVDGRARIPTLERIAAQRVLRPGGMLFLHDAATYRKVAETLFPGGRFLEGRGGFKNALRPDQAARSLVPDEAYLWRMPPESDSSHA